jgi:hypothetical protein
MPAPEWSADLQAPEGVCCQLGQYISACALVTPPGTGFPGIGPYQFAWYSSGDDRNFVPHPGNLSCPAILVSQHCGSSSIYIKVEISSADGQLITLEKQVQVLDHLPNSPCPEPRPGSGFAPLGEAAQESAALRILPNPASGVFWLEAPQASAQGGAAVYIIGASGQAVKSMLLDGSTSPYPIDLSACPAGLYILRYVPAAGGAPQTLKLIKR